MAEAQLENNEIKQRAVRRLVAAVVLVLVAVGILTYLSYYKPAKVVTKPIAQTLPPPPPPIVTGPEPEQILPAQPGQPLPELPPPLPVPTDAPPATNGTPVPPPPPSVTSKPLPQPGPGPKKSPQPAAQAPLVPAQNLAASAKPAEAPPQPLAAAAPKPSAAPAAGYVVQFGVFGNPKNAQQLVEKLKQAGIDAQTETRVQLPSFKTKAKAEAALAKMRDKGITATVVAR